MSHYRLFCSYECYPFLTNVGSHFISEKKMLMILRQLTIFKEKFSSITQAQKNSVSAYFQDLGCDCRDK